MTIDTAAEPHIGSTSAAWSENARDRASDSSRRSARRTEKDARPAPNVYRALDRESREAAINAVLAQMIRRGGPPDALRGTLERRERAMAALARDPVKWQGPPCVNAADFAARLAQPLARPVHARALWALAVAKLNRIEAFGVSTERRSWARKAPRVEDWRVYVNLEEGYHTRLLHVVLGALGVDARQSRPSWLVTLAIRAMLLAPSWLQRAVLLTAEVVSCVLVAHLLRLTRPLFGEQPAVCERIERALGEILTDDVAHVRLLQSSMPRGVMRLASGMRRWVIAVFAAAVPELDLLLGRERLHYACDSLDLDTLAVTADRARGVPP